MIPKSAAKLVRLNPQTLAFQELCSCCVAVVVDEDVFDRDFFGAFEHLANSRDSVRYFVA